MNKVETQSRISAKKAVKIWVPVFIVFWIAGMALDTLGHTDNPGARRSFTAAQYLIVYIFLICLFAYISYARTYLKISRGKTLASAKIKALKALNNSLVVFFGLWLINLFILHPTSQGAYLNNFYWTHLLKEAGLFIFLSVVIAFIVYGRSKQSV